MKCWTDRFSACT